MKKAIVFVVVCLSASLSFAAQPDQQKRQASEAKAAARGSNETKAEARDKRLDAGSNIEAEMSSMLDLKRAKPGDSFKMKTTRPIKRDGKEVFSRGSTITGHIEQITRAEKQTQATLVFDGIEDKRTRATGSLEAVVTTVLRAEQTSSIMSDEMTAPPSGPPPSRGSQGGGLLGGTLNTVGGVTGQIGSTVNSTTGATLGGDSSSGAGLGNLPRGAIQILTDTTANAGAGSTLALSDKNPRIETGTRFILTTVSEVVLHDQKRERTRTREK